MLPCLTVNSLSQVTEGTNECWQRGIGFGITSSHLIRPPLSPTAHLLILVPRQGLSRQHKPVLLGAALHQADIVDGQPAPADHLVGRTHLSREDSLVASSTLCPSPEWMEAWFYGRVTSSPKPDPSSLSTHAIPAGNQTGSWDRGGDGWTYRQTESKSLAQG